MGMKKVLYNALVAVGAVRTATGQFNNPPGVLIWCGKAYNSK